MRLFCLRSSAPKESKCVCVCVCVCVHEETSEGRSEQDQLTVTVRLRPDPPPLRYRQSSANVVWKCSSIGGPVCLTAFGVRSSRAHWCLFRRKICKRAIVLVRHFVPAALSAGVRRSHIKAGLLSEPQCLRLTVGTNSKFHDFPMPSYEATTEPN